MLTRRHLLLTTAVTSAFGLSAARAVALSTEPMAAEDLRAMRLACGGALSHAELVAEARLFLDGQVQAGERAADYSETIRCPLCACSLQVVPEIRF